MDAADLDVRMTRLEVRHQVARTLLDGYIADTDAHLDRLATAQRRLAEQMRLTMADTDAALARTHATITAVAENQSRLTEMIELSGRSGSAFADEAVRRHEADRHDE